MAVPMFDRLYALPDLAILGVFCGAGILAMVIIPRVIHLIFPYKPCSDSQDFAIRTQATLITLCTLLLGFLLVQAYNNLHRVEGMVESEATQAVQLDRALLRMGGPDVPGLRRILREYVQSVVKEEWPALGQGKGSPRTRDGLSALTGAVTTLDMAAGANSARTGQLFRLVDALNESRQQRVVAAGMGLPDLFWTVVISFLALAFAMAVLIPMTVPRSIALGGQAVAMSGLLGLVFITDRPFMGQTSVGPEAMLRALEAMSLIPL